MEEVVFKSVKKRLGNFLLDIPRLAIKKGYITGFVGENGAGKTTTIRLMLDMIMPDEGEIEIDGMHVRGSEREIKEQIGYVGEPTGFPDESKLIDIKKMIAPFYSTWDDKLFDVYASQFQLKLESKYRELSVGQKKQFAIVMALSHHPKLIILDEPTAGLDPVVRNEILDILMAHMENEEVTTFYSTHITSDLEKAGDYIIYIRDGKIIFNEEMQQILETYCVVKGSPSLLDQDIKKELLGYRVSEMSFTALVADRKKAEDLFGRKVKYTRPTIEEIMILLSKQGRNE